MRLEVLRGGTCEPGAGFGAAPVAVIKEAFARRFLPGREPLGRRVIFADDGGPRTIVGVIANVRHRNLAEAATPEIYLSQAQWPSSGMAIVVRSTSTLSNLIAPIRAAVGSVDRGVPISAVTTTDDLVAGP